MSEEEIKKIAKEEFMNNVMKQLDSALIFTYIQNLENQLQQKENIIKEVRESAKRELKIAEENIKNSEQWLEVEEEQEHAKKDIHTGKIVKRYMEMVLEILDKEVN